jgi:hypothetical protein
VTPAVRVLQAALLGLALALAPSVSACGYHDAGSINRGMLNWAYPNALYVTSAVWKAQLDGLLSRDDRPAATRALLGYGTAVKELGQLRDGLSLVRDHGRDDPTISLVLIGPMLWARLAPANTRLEMIPHTTGPSSGDVVIVTDEPVIKALVEGQVAPQTAQELGLIRFYGAPEAVQRAASWLNRLNQPAIEVPVKSSG